VPTCEGNGAEGREKVMAKEGKTDKKNYPKYDSYRLAFGMIDDALKCGCPLQAITIEESILTDRLSSTLNVGISKGKPYKTLGSVLNAWRPKNKNKQPHSNAKLFDLEMNNLYERLDKWREARNNLLHGLVKSFQGEEPETPAGDFIKTATKQAEEGLYLVKKVKNWVQKQVRNAKKAKVK
jgi:hypothetical protein